MSRPAAPSYTVPTWATEANYPVGTDDWSGQPTKVVHPAPAGGFTPNQGAPAEYFNHVLNAAFEADDAAKAAITANHTWVGQIPALSFSQQVTSIDTVNRLHFNRGRRQWFAMGPSANLQMSARAGWTWFGNQLSGVAAGTENLAFADHDNPGDMVVTCANLAAVFVLDSGGWTKLNVGGGGTINSGTPKVAYNPFLGMWCLLWSDAVGGAAVVYTSVNKTTWTARGNAVSWLSGQEALGCNRGLTGRLVACGTYFDSTFVKVSTSDDGGVTWTARASLDRGFDSLAADIYVHNVEGTNTWYLVSSKTASGNQSRVWRSLDDGATWTLMSTLTSCLRDFAVMGSLLVAVTSFPDIVYSIDGGATWRYAGFQPDATARGAYEGGGSVIVATAASVWPSAVRTGLPDLGTL